MKRIKRKKKSVAESLKEKPYVVRHIKYFSCATKTCKTKIAQSRYLDRAKKSLCGKCRRAGISENQLNLFPQIEVENGSIVEVPREDCMAISIQVETKGLSSLQISS